MVENAVPYAVLDFYEVNLEKINPASVKRCRLNFKDDFWPLKTFRDVLRKQKVILASLMMVAFYNQRLEMINYGLTWR